MSDDRTVLFVCRHGAAKSVLAAAELRRLADERGIRIVASSAGLEPDEELSPALIGLVGDAGDLDVSKPRPVTPGDLASADRVITFDLEPTELPARAGRIERWDDVPSVGDDPQRALAAIDGHVRRLLDEG